VRLLIPLFVILAACAAPESVDDLAKHDLQCESVHVFLLPGYPRDGENLAARTCNYWVERRYHVEGCDRSRNYVCKECKGISSQDVCEGDGPVVE
jgi:hypothetical protein